MTREDIDRIASDYFNDKESEHEMDEVFDLAKKALEKQMQEPCAMLDCFQPKSNEKPSSSQQSYNEEVAKAIDLLDNLIGMVEDNHSSDYDTALRMGIEALKQRPTAHWITGKYFDAIAEVLAEMRGKK